VASSLIRYSLTGAGMTVTIYLAYLGVTALNVTPVWAIAMVYPLAVLASYFLNKSWAFRSSRPHVESVWRFILTHSVGYLLNISLLAVFTTVFPWSHQVVEAIVLVVVGGFLFFALRLFVFPREEERARRLWGRARVGD